MSKHLSEFTKGKIIAYYEQKWSLKKISDELKINRSTIGYVVKKYKDRGHTLRKKVLSIHQPFLLHKRHILKAY
ncbi:hypothetical protein EHP00_1576 [Ecytonucleospora hepatopenaei]|uniref:Uncharacterized protein n=1 Tax=Ecytonucleospora hepatopenaei TaxID=646526 RepID=A0A1W0E8M9_9MICR|nr:hypothetical protein EHP00_1576 [Ecytonucleospora hepatopenaei]